MKFDRALMFSFLLVLLVGFQVQAQDWPHWRGPDRDGTTTSNKFKATFGKGGVKELWSADLGVGFTGVTVADGKAYSAGWKGGKTTFFCFDAETGKEIWSHSFATKKYDNLNVGGPSGTAAVDGDHVYHMARDGKLLCYKTEDGTVAWEKELTKDFGVKVPRWGFSGSPVIIDDMLYLDIGRIIALDKKTGAEQWKTKDYGPAYSTPAPFTFKGKDYLAVFPKTGLYILERDGGKEIAHHPWKTQYDVHAATPVIIENKFIFISSDYNTGCALLEFDGKGVDVVWENRDLKNQMCTSIYYKGSLYGFNSSVLTCLDAGTGDRLWQVKGHGKGTLIMAGDKLVVLSDKGTILTATADREGFRTISEVQLIKGDSTIWTSPTLANGRLYVRGSKGTLVCIDVSK